jgi:long-chain acyl-CoA synthetase
MHPRQVALATPNKPAIIIAETGQTKSYAELVSSSNRIARYLRTLGLRQGDNIAILMENHLDYFDAVWAALNSGLYITTLSSHLTREEIAYILNDCRARALFTSDAMYDRVAGIQSDTPNLTHVLVVDSAKPDAIDLREVIAPLSDAPLPDERQGAFMVYSSGTTGQPKGIRPSMPDLAIDEPMGVVAAQLKLFPFDQDTIYLSPAPLFHTAPLKWNVTVQTAGGTCVILKKFDAERCLAEIERHRVTLAQFVPTMFARMLSLPAEVRDRYTLDSLKLVVHAAAPCPPDIKKAMINWLGPIIDEYYAASESNGLCLIRCKEWLERPGSVGRSVRGPVHIMSDDGETELPTREEGLIYFEGGTPFAYHNDPEKTAAAHNSKGWSAVGDVGFVDEDGFLFLTDRRHDLVISGGVNIYPRETEDVLAGSPLVHDAAVIGTPHPDLGEELRAIVQLNPGVDPARAEEELRVLCANRLAGPKRPRVYEFVDALPRLETGKLLKRKLRERYWGGQSAVSAINATRGMQTIAQPWRGSPAKSEK